MSKASKETNKPEQTLFNAVASSKLRLVRLLIEGGVNVDSRNDRGQTPLLITCSLLTNTCHTRWETREKVVKYLISVGADVNIHDIIGRTPLIYAVITRASVLFDLIDAGADPWEEDCSHKCAFDYALQNQDIAQIEIMVYAYKKRPRGIAGDVEDARDNGETRNTRDSRESGNMRDVTDTGLDHSRSSSPRKKEKKKLKKKLKVCASKNRKRLVQSRNIGAPTLTLTASSDNSTRASLPQDGHGNVDSCKDPLLVTPCNPCDLQESRGKNSTSPPKFLQIHENSLLCDLCKSVLNEQLQNKTDIFYPSFPDDLNFTDNDLSGLLFRRRSTGCLFGLKGQGHDFYESIRQKHESGMTMEDLFSNTEINQPENHHHLANELLLPDRTRSASVCLPLQNDAMRNVQDRMFCSPDDFPFIISSAKSVPELHTIAWSRPGSPEFTPQSSVYLGSDDECNDVMTPISCRSNTSSPIFGMMSSPRRSMTSSPIRSITSSPLPDTTSSPIRSRTSSPLPDTTSSPIRSRTSSPIRSMTSSPNYDFPSQCRPSSAFSDYDSLGCNSSIPTIILTDCVNTDEM